MRTHPRPRCPLHQNQPAHRPPTHPPRAHPKPLHPASLPPLHTAGLQMRVHVPSLASSPFLRHPFPPTLSDSPSATLPPPCSCPLAARTGRTPSPRRAATQQYSTARDSGTPRRRRSSWNSRTGWGRVQMTGVEEGKGKGWCRAGHTQLGGIVRQGEAELCWDAALLDARIRHTVASQRFGKERREQRRTRGVWYGGCDASAVWRRGGGGVTARSAWQRSQLQVYASGVTVREGRTATLPYCRTWGSRAGPNPSYTHSTGSLRKRRSPGA